MLPIHHPLVVAITSLIRPSIQCYLIKRVSLFRSLLKRKVAEKRKDCPCLIWIVSFRMSQDLVFTLLGDSNIQRSMNSTNCRDRPLMSDAQVIPCGRLELLAEALKQARASSNVIVLSCITNFLTGSTDATSSISIRVEPILKEVQTIVEAASLANEERLYLIAPPMYRTFPIWYRDGISEVLQKFSSMLCSKPTGPKNMLLLPSFSTPSFEGDGIHLTPYSGLEFILHLFDSSAALVQTLNSRPEEVVIKQVESSRVLEDRMMAIEQDHRRLNQVVEEKIAVDSELADFQENVRYEDHFVVLGLARIPKCDTRVWQDKAKRLVGDFLKELMGHEYKIVFIKNITGKSKDSIPRYQVQMDSVAASQAIRDKFGTFFPGGKDSRQIPSLKFQFATDSPTRPASESTSCEFLPNTGRLQTRGQNSNALATGRGRPSGSFRARTRLIVVCSQCISSRPSRPCQCRSPQPSWSPSCARSSPSGMGSSGRSSLCFQMT